MSRDLGSHAGSQAPGTLGVGLRQVHLLLHLRVDRFAAQAQAGELWLSQLRPFWRLVGFGRSQQVQRARLLQLALKSRIIGGSLSK